MNMPTFFYHHLNYLYQRQINKFKNPCLRLVFGSFSQLFLENLALSCTTSYEFLAPCQNLEKTNDKIPSKCPNKQDRQKGKRTERPYFTGPLKLPPGVQKHLI